MFVTFPLKLPLLLIPESEKYVRFKQLFLFWLIRFDLNRSSHTTFLTTI